jgi:hypothetical protein
MAEGIYEQTYEQATHPIPINEFTTPLYNSFLRILQTINDQDQLLQTEAEEYIEIIRNELFKVHDNYKTRSEYSIINNILNILNSHFEEENVYQFFSNNVYTFRIRFPKITIKNSKNTTYDIEEFYLDINLSINNSNNIIMKDMAGRRGIMSKREIQYGYIHSHVSSFGGRYCTGSSELTEVISNISNKIYNADLFELFIITLKEAVKWESIEGTPHKRIDELKKSSSKIMYNILNSDTYSFINNYHRVKELVFKSIINYIEKEGFEKFPMIIGDNSDDIVFKSKEHFDEFNINISKNILEDLKHIDLALVISKIGEVYYYIPNQEYDSRRYIEGKEFRFKDKTIKLQLKKEVEEIGSSTECLRPVVLEHLLTEFINFTKEYYFNKKLWRKKVENKLI